LRGQLLCGLLGGKPGGSQLRFLGGTLRGHLFRSHLLRGHLLCGLFRGVSSGLQLRQLSSLQSSVLGGLLDGLFCCHAGSFLRSFLSRFLHGQVCGLLRSDVREAGLFLRAGQFGGAAHFYRFFQFIKGMGLGGVDCWGLGFQVLNFQGGLSSALLQRARLFFFHGLQHTLTRFFTRLCSRRRKVTIFGAMQVGPGIKRRYIFRRLILVVQRSTLSHSSPQNLPL
jgi:hypothetical protein